ncbi:hypothetical protein CSC94_12575 [Zhengella mangrovi]|uniref:Uncharacterized protein n=1 Tax=Zhengella mangrovi TaxID=1982044 RepID=A0A2G1QM37_9HYPH|nr:hypothetical protein CSC94_12575 [Zhengella mangrovi]
MLVEAPKSAGETRIQYRARNEALIWTAVVTIEVHSCAVYYIGSRTVIIPDNCIVAEGDLLELGFRLDQ